MREYGRSGKCITGELLKIKQSRLDITNASNTENKLRESRKKNNSR